MLRLTLLCAQEYSTSAQVKAAAVCVQRLKRKYEVAKMKLESDFRGSYRPQFNSKLYLSPLTWLEIRVTVST